jgi:hypothetical protein
MAINLLENSRLNNSINKTILLELTRIIVSPHRTEFALDPIDIGIGMVVHVQSWAFSNDTSMYQASIAGNRKCLPLDTAAGDQGLVPIRQTSPHPAIGGALVHLPLSEPPFVMGVNRVGLASGTADSAEGAAIGLATRH